MFSKINEQYCFNGCCTFRIADMPKQKYIPKGKAEKAGAFIVDSSKKSILLVRSKYKDVWGISKGSIEIGETIKEGAIREVKEETGIDLNVNDLKNKIHNNPEHIYYVDKKENYVEPVDTHDVNAIGWIKLECLILMSARGAIDLNNITRKLLRKIYNISFDSRTPYMRNALTEAEVISMLR